MGRYEFDKALSRAKGEGFRAGQEIGRLVGLVLNDREVQHQETGILPEYAEEAIKVRGDQPGWTVQVSLLVDPEERLLLNYPRGKDSPNTPNRP